MAETHSEYQANLARALERWLEFSPESMQRITPIRKFIEEQRRDDKREDLRLLLGSRFGPLPEALTSQLDAIHDIDELSQMYRRALDAQTLAEVGLREQT